MLVIDLLRQYGYELLNESPSQKSTCPLCSGSDHFLESSCSTLLAGIGDSNPNHIWNTYWCQRCSTEYVREIKKDNVWYTKDRLVLKGVPTCFEHYSFKCSCGGLFNSRHYKLNTDEEVSYLSFGRDGEKLYKTVYACQNGCFEQVVEDDYHRDWRR